MFEIDWASGSDGEKKSLGIYSLTGHVAGFCHKREGPQKKKKGQICVLGGKLGDG